MFVAVGIQHAMRMRLFYCNLWPVRVYNIFPHYPINGTIWWKELLNIRCVFWFSVPLLSVTFLILRWT